MRRALVPFSTFCATLGVAVYVVAFDTRQGLSWDAETLAAATSNRDIPRVQATSSGLIATIDVASLILFGGGIIAVALLLGRARAALAAGIVIGGANGTTQALKPLLGSIHPFGEVRGALASSFPSGHATVAMSLGLAAVIAAPPAWKLAASLAGAAYAAGVGVSLLVQASHYPSDVAGAYLVAGAWAGTVAALLPDRHAEERPRSLGAGLATAALAAIGFTVAVAVAVHTHPGIVVRVHLQTKLVLVLVVLCAIAIAVAAALALLLQASAFRSASTTRT